MSVSARAGGRVLALVALVLVSLVLGLGPSGALAQDAGVEPSASDWLRAGQDAESAADPGAALDAYRHVVSSAPGSRLGRRAQTRIAWLEARGDGGYAPLAALLGFQGRTPAERTPDVVAAFEVVVAAMPSGLVRAEARVAVAGEWTRLGDTPRALAAWQAALDDPDASPSQRQMIRESMARARMDGGDLAGALGELEGAGLGDVTLHHVVERRMRAGTWVPVACAVVATFALVVLALVARSGRARELARSLVGLRSAVALLVGAGPTMIVEWWGDDSVRAFEAFAPAAVAVVLLSYLAAEATDSPRARAAVGVLAIAASIAAAYVAVALRGEALPFA